MTKINVETTSNKSIRQQIESEFKELKNEYKSRVKSFYGSNIVRDDMFETGLVFKDVDNVTRADPRSSKNSFYNEIADRFSEAFKEHYEDLQDIHRSKHAGRVRPEAHMKRKRGPNSNPPHGSDVNRGTHTPVSYAMWTGYLKDSISHAFELGGSMVMETTNYLVAGGYKLKERRIPSDVYFGNAFDPSKDEDGNPVDRKSNARNFMEHFEEVSNIQKRDLIKFDGNFWNDISGVMMQGLRAGIIHPFKEVFGELEVRI